MATLLLFDSVSERYRETSQAIKEVKLNEKIVIKKTLVEMMRQSFFHGPNRYGNNFIA